jgi:tRNA A37 methylthiotransferase MiaB
LVEGKPINGNLWSGLTDNYVRAMFEGGSDHVGDIVSVVVESASQGAVLGRLLK